MPSLQITGPLLLPDEEEPADDELAAGAAGAAGAALDAALPVEVVPAEADLLMPPCPLQAPRPPCGEVVPSLQTTAPEVLCANEGAGAASSTPASATPPIRPVSFVRSMCSSPSDYRLFSLLSEYPKRCAGGTRRRAPATSRRGADVVRL